MNKNQKFKLTITEIFKVSSKIRFVSMIDLNGDIIISEMKPDVQTLLKKSSEEKFCKHVAVRREMRHEFDKKFLLSRILQKFIYNQFFFVPFIYNINWTRVS